MGMAAIYTGRGDIVGEGRKMVRNRKKKKNVMPTAAEAARVPPLT
jgi:hypothetical protein